MAFSLETPAFESGAPIPQKYTGIGENMAPPLSWRDLPPGTESLVLIVEDHDAPVGTVTHWATYDLDPKIGGLPEGTQEVNIAQAMNDMGHARYDGPKPPKGHGPHRYHFRLSALNVKSLSLPRAGNASGR
jgi:Raf kinase inhibitor-like YbhB/YbcL family protein